MTPDTKASPELDLLGFRIVLPARSSPERVEARLRIAGIVALAVGVAFPLFGFLPELVHLTPDVNDGAFHMGMAQAAVDALKEGANPLDFWFPNWMCGYPLFYYYQPGPYLVLAAAHHVIPGLSLYALYRAMNILVLTLFPLMNYKALRWLGFPFETACLAGFLSWMLHSVSSHTFGIELESYTAMGWGLFAQGCAQPFLPLAIAGGYRAITGERRTLKYAAFLTGAFLTHILFGYIAVLSYILVPFLALRRDEILRRFVALGRFGVQVLGLSGWFVLPLMLGTAYHSKSIYDAAWKFDSKGAKPILTWIFSGDFLDQGRLPILTCFAAAGLYLCLRRWLEEKKEAYGFVACGLVLWVLIYFGRATWGPLMDLLPMAKGLHIHRLSSGVQIFAIWLAAVGLSGFLRWVLSFEAAETRAAWGAVLLVLLFYVATDRARYLRANADLLAGTPARPGAKEIYNREIREFRPILDRIREKPGRVYAGHSGNWGRSYLIGGVAVMHVLSIQGIPTVGHMPFSWPLTTDFQGLFASEWDADFDLYNVRYLVTQQGALDQNHLRLAPRAQLVLSSGRHRLYEFPVEGPFSVVSVPIAVRGDKETTWYVNMSWVKLAFWAKEKRHIQLLLRPGHKADGRPEFKMTDALHYLDPGGAEHNLFEGQRPDLLIPENLAAYLKIPPGNPLPLPAKGTGIRPGSVVESRNEARATVDLDEDGVLLFKQTFHPQWKAYVNGKPVKTMVLSPGLIGIPVRQGKNEVRAAYEPGMTKILLLLLGIAAAVFIDRSKALRGFLGRREE